MKKAVIWSTSVIFVSIVLIYVLLVRQDTINERSREKDYISYKYVITEVSDKGYIGDSLTDNTGIYFEESNLEDQTIKEGDVVKVYFEKGNFEGIKKIVVAK